MNVTAAMRAVVAGAPDALLVASLGTVTSALREVTNDGPHLYMGGAMGSALAAAIGVAEKRRTRAVIGVIGDGEALMGASSIWSLAGVRPDNLLAVVMADGHYNITGGQPIPTPLAFAQVAATLGLASAVASCEDEIERHVRTLSRPGLLEVQYSERVWPGPSAFVDPHIVRWRFEQEATGVSVR